MPDSNAPLVLREDKDAIAVVLLNRPAQRNALRYESWTELSELLSDVAADSEVAAVVVAGADGFFCAGGDLKTGPVHGTGPLAPAGRVEHAQRVMEQLKAVPVPTVAAVEGAAVGLGWSLALSCDLVVAASNVFFSAPFVARAVVPDGGLAWRLTHQAGLVTDVAEPGSAVDHAVALATELADADRGAVEMTKRLINAAEAAQLATFHPLELAMATVAQQRSASVVSH